MTPTGSADVRGEAEKQHGLREGHTGVGRAPATRSTSTDTVKGPTWTAESWCRGVITGDVA